MARSYKERVKKAPGYHTFWDWCAIKEKYQYKCAACGCKKFLTKDHILCIADGGSNNPDNLQPLCKRCHYKKTRSEIRTRGIKNVRSVLSNK